MTPEEWLKEYDLKLYNLDRIPYNDPDKAHPVIEWLCSLIERVIY